MEKINFENLPSTNTPINAENLNQIQTNVEDIFDGNVVAGNMVVESIRTKNMFGNYLVRNGYISSPAFMRIRDTLTDRMAFVPCEANTTYTVSRTILTTTFRVGEYTSAPVMTDSNVDYSLPQNIVENNSGTEITYTTGATAKYLIIMYGNITNDSNINDSLATIQVEKGSTATAYTPYQNLTGDLAYTKSTYTSNGISIRFEKVGRIVQCTFEGTATSNLTANTDYNVSIDSAFNPKELMRTCVIFNETGTIGYVWVDASQSKIYYRVKTTVNSPSYPRFIFTYISAN